MQNKQVGKYYNNKIKKDYNNRYEQERWFSSDIRQAGYKMTLATIKKHLSNIRFTHCLELGPGHGTWTTVLMQTNPKARFDLVDISSQMIKLAQAKIGDKGNIRYFVKDFLEFDPRTHYDFFFSSRAIEYIEPKEKVIKKIADLLVSDSYGFIITKTPHYFRSRLRGRSIPTFHQGQIKPRDLVKFLKKYNCRVLGVYPVTFNFPLLRSARLNMFLYKFFSRLRLNFLSYQFCESYCVKFRKQ